MEKLSIMSEPAVRHVDFGIFNLAWPDIMFWGFVIVFFALAVWLRIPKIMESDAASKTRAGE